MHEKVQIGLLCRFTVWLMHFGILSSVLPDFLERRSSLQQALRTQLLAAKMNTEDEQSKWAQHSNKIFIKRVKV